jgi:hypothetical protein
MNHDTFPRLQQEVKGRVGRRIIKLRSEGAGLQEEGPTPIYQSSKSYCRK